MARRGSTLAALLVLTSAAAHAAGDPAVEREAYIRRALAPHPEPAIVAHKRLTAAGSGVYVTAHEIVTNDHVVEGCAAVTSRTDGSDWAPARTTGRDAAADLAVLTSDMASSAPAAVPAPAESDSDAARLAVVGFPELGRLTIRPVLVTAAARPADLISTRPAFPLRATLHFGNSGSPVLDPAGNVVGIVSKKIDSVAVYRASGRLVEDLGLAVSADTLRRFLDAHGVAYRGSRAPPVPGPGLLDRARRFVVQIGCWR